MYDVYISYTRADQRLYEALRDALRGRAVSVWDDGDIKMEELIRISDRITEAVSDSKVFICLLSENSVKSEWVEKECYYAVEKASVRRKTIIPVMAGQVELKGSVLEFLLLRYQFCYLDLSGGITAESPGIRQLADLAAKLVHEDHEDEYRMEKLQGYIKAGASGEAANMLCDLIEQTSDSLTADSSAGLRDRKSLFLGITRVISCLDKMKSLYNYDYSDDGRRLAHRKLDCLDKFRALIRLLEPDADELLNSAVQIISIYFDREVRWECADTITGGDVSDYVVKALPVKDYKEKQAPFAKRYRRLIRESGLSAENRAGYSLAEAGFILQAANYIYEDIADGAAWGSVDAQKFRNEEMDRQGTANVDGLQEMDGQGTANVDGLQEMDGQSTANVDGLQEMDGQGTANTDELLQAAAVFLREGNKIFDHISHDGASEDFIRCLITSYERLEKYCGIVGAKKIQKECIDQRYQLQMKLEGSAFGESPVNAREGLCTLLGITVPNDGRYDVFLSHKNEDYDIAEQIYHFLTRNLKEVFFDKKTLPELSDSQYRRAIMQGLDHSDHFIVVLSNLDYLKAKWIEEEMETFCGEITEGRKEGSNFIFIVTEDVYRQIIGSNKKVLPIEYRKFEILRFEDYENVLLNYIRRKPG